MPPLPDVSLLNSFQEREKTQVIPNAESSQLIITFYISYRRTDNVN